jgi:hypothetical protein
VVVIVGCKVVGKRGGVKACEVLDGVKAENGRVKKMNRNVGIIGFGEEVEVEGWNATGFIVCGGWFRSILVWVL